MIRRLVQALLVVLALIAFGVVFGNLLARRAAVLENTGVGWLRDIDLASGEQWNLLYQGNNGEWSMIEGRDKLQASSDQILVREDWMNWVPGEGGRFELRLVRDGKTIKTGQASQAGKMTFGTAASLFTPITPCFATIQKVDQRRYLASYSSGQIILENPIPELKYAHMFAVNLPTFGIVASPEFEIGSTEAFGYNQKQLVVIKNRIAEEAHRLFPGVDFEIEVSDTNFWGHFVDGRGTPLQRNDGTIIKDDTRTYHNIRLDIFSDAKKWYDTLPTASFDRLVSGGNFEMPLADLIRRLTAQTPSASPPIQLELSEPKIVTASRGDWLLTESRGYRYFVRPGQSCAVPK